MKVRIGRDFYDKKNDTIYTAGEVASVNNDVGTWIIRNNLGHIIPNVKVGKKVSINNRKTEKSKAIDESQKEDRMVRNAKNK